MAGFIKNMMGSGLSGLQSLSVSGYLTNGATATGTNQATGYVLQTEYTVFSTVAASTAAVLPVGATASISPTDELIVANNGANALLVFPPVGGQIGTASVNASLSVPAGKVATFVNISSLNYIANLSA